MAQRRAQSTADKYQKVAHLPCPLCLIVPLCRKAATAARIVAVTKKGGSSALPPSNRSSRSDQAFENS
jgi:hypothetical protein